MHNSNGRLRAGRELIWVAGKTFAAPATAIVTSLAVFLAGLAIPLDDADAKRKRKRSRSPIVSIPIEKPKRPLVLVVSLGAQKVTVFDGENVVRRSPISSGKEGNRTPKGIFSIVQKHREHYSNLYNDAPMPFMQRLTWSGIALHHGRLPGYAASHGCIRLPWEFSKNLFSITSMRTRVIVTDDMVRPRIFKHDALIRPLPPISYSYIPLPTRPGSTMTSTASANAVSPKRPQTVATNTPGTAGANTATDVAQPETQAATKGSLAVTSAVIATPADGAGETSDAIAALESTAPRSVRAQLRIARLAKMRTLKSQSRKSKKALAAARDENTKMRLVLRKAGRDAIVVRKNFSNLKRQVTRARRNAKDAADDLADFERKYANKTFDPVVDAVKLARAEERENQLEAAYFDAVDEADVSSGDMKSMRQRQTVYLDAVKTAQKQLTLASADARQKAVVATTAENARVQAMEKNRLRNNPIAIFISRKKGRIYIRQRYHPIFEAPVEIANPDQPLGTHVFTALEFTDDKRDLEWSVVSFDGQVRTPQERRSQRRSRRKRYNISYKTVRADKALERITLNKETKALIAQLIKPGSSLIISDKRASNETGRRTDFIVKLN